MQVPGFLHRPGGRKAPRRSILAADSDVGRPAEDTLADLGVRPPSDPFMALHASRRPEPALLTASRSLRAMRTALAAAGR